VDFDASPELSASLPVSGHSWDMLRANQFGTLLHS
jgi:hypothetical protein